MFEWACVTEGIWVNICFLSSCHYSLNHWWVKGLCTESRFTFSCILRTTSMQRISEARLSRLSSVRNRMKSVAKVKNTGGTSRKPWATANTSIMFCRVPRSRLWIKSSRFALKYPRQSSKTMIPLRNALRCLKVYLGLYTCLLMPVK